MTIFPSTIGTAHQSVSQSVSQSFSEDLVVAELTAEHGNTITTGGEHYASPLARGMAAPIQLLPPSVMTFDCAPPTDIRLNKQY